MKKIIFLLTPLSILLFLGSCKNTVSVLPVEDKPFYETKWVLKQLSGKNLNWDSGKIPYIVFTESTRKATGKSTCNTFNGPFICDYKKGGEVFKMGATFTTKIACNDGNIETDFYNALRNAGFVKVVGNQLFMTSTLSSNINPLATLEAE